VNRTHAELRIRLLSEWGITTGESDGFGADNTIVRTVDGLPYIPGHSLRGLLRDALVSLVDGKRIHKLFGQAGKDAGESETGSLSVSRAMLAHDNELTETGMSIKEVGQALTLVRTQTKINAKTGGVKAGSLRSIEVAAPGLEFSADISVPDEDFVIVQRAALLVRRLGHSRSRGYGHCQMALVRKQDAPARFEDFRNKALEQARKESP